MTPLERAELMRENEWRRQESFRLTQMAMRRNQIAMVILMATLLFKIWWEW